MKGKALLLLLVLSIGSQWSRADDFPEVSTESLSLHVQAESSEERAIVPYEEPGAIVPQEQVQNRVYEWVMNSSLAAATGAAGFGSVFLTLIHAQDGKEGVKAILIPFENALRSASVETIADFVAMTVQTHSKEALVAGIGGITLFKFQFLNEHIQNWVVKKRLFKGNGLVHEVEKIAKSYSLSLIDAGVIQASMMAMGLTPEMSLPEHYAQWLLIALIGLSAEAPLDLMLSEKTIDLKEKHHKRSRLIQLFSNFLVAALTTVVISGQTLELMGNPNGSQWLVNLALAGGAVYTWTLVKKMLKIRSCAALFRRKKNN